MSRHFSLIQVTKTLVLWAVGLLLFVAAGKTLAQDYHWQRTFPYQAYSVAFNPLSHGKVVFSESQLADGIMRSDDGGFTWQYYSEGLDVPRPAIHQLLCLPTDTNIVLAVTPNNLYRSTDAGRSWSHADSLGGIDGEDLSYYAPNDEVYYGQNFAGPIWRSSDHGKTWIQSGARNSSVTLCTLSVSNDASRTMLVGSENGIIDRSTDEGANWTVVFPSESPGTPEAPEIPKIVFSERASNAAIATRWLSAEHSIVLTQDRGLTWSTLASPERHAWALDLDQRAASILNGIPTHFWTGLFFQSEADTVVEGLVEESTDAGKSWHTTHFPATDSVKGVFMLKYDTTAGVLIAATDQGIYVGEDPESVLREDVVGDLATVYPNPATNKLIVSLPERLRSGTLQLFNAVGQCVVSEPAQHLSVQSIDISGLAPAVYFLRVASRASGKNLVQKIVKIQ